MRIRFRDAPACDMICDEKQLRWVAVDTVHLATIRKFFERSRRILW
jgi:hypothetical protein